MFYFKRKSTLKDEVKREEEWEKDEETNERLKDDATLALVTLETNLGTTAFIPIESKMKWSRESEKIRKHIGPKS